MSKVRVLIVDDSAIMRKLISDLLTKEKDIEIVAQATNGKEAIEKARLLKPDVITLDIEMPEMDGLTALKFLKKEVPQTKVIMFSSLTQEGAKATLEALSLGAYDFVPKPSSKSFLESVKKIEMDLVPKIRSVNAPRDIKHFKPSFQTSKLKTGIYKVLGIGVSTGGPQTLMEIFKNIPSTLRVPIFIVQHMPPLFTKQLAERLDKLTPLTVKEAENGEPVKEGHVYIAPGDYHMKVTLNNKERTITLTQDSPINNCRPAVDVLFESLAEVYNGACLAIVLTGMGKDGTEGARKIKQKGGGVIAQDSQSSIVFGMPRAVIEAGLADEILNLEDIPKRLRELFRV
ncbi:MAG: chemotaxis response regulator protein-glutamate methylesterase [Caldimicrobium sp.]|nr:chemotaxis response regulator protein-glutamate methylesterase [Caldimicrobium sp.]MCX7613607.1 chemotaxis response regulator protein-glutamate methylesterase [Caldimicrobium sp.]MDW8183086.1 chemotaxis response regulator protein-glutamate methylesterase [Caldimicrobium sp.]